MPAQEQQQQQQQQQQCREQQHMGLHHHQHDQQQQQQQPETNSRAPSPSPSLSQDEESQWHHRQLQMSQMSGNVAFGFDVGGSSEAMPGGKGGGGGGVWGEDARTTYLGSPESVHDASIGRARENGGSGPWRVAQGQRPMSAMSTLSPCSVQSTGYAQPEGGDGSSHRSRSSGHHPALGGGGGEGGRGGGGDGSQATTPLSSPPPPSSSLWNRPASAAAAPSGMQPLRGSPHASQDRSPLACFPGGQQRVAQVGGGRCCCTFLANISTNCYVLCNFSK